MLYSSSERVGLYGRRSNAGGGRAGAFPDNIESRVTITHHVFSYVGQRPLEGDGRLGRASISSQIKRPLRSDLPRSARDRHSDPYPLCVFPGNANCAACRIAQRIGFGTMGEISPALAILRQRASRRRLTSCSGESQ